ncbi:hypothetical protein EUTSA_v10022402mg [Eutrema salsugineum]|uniref:F-box domain-containing protein n=1 Tax=Eutrema salsugineum TaxID=72664 RepID=V4LEF9_EUTSA|nr:hypothetical protein EUTSA_v10022402mg [Eutrema salsugineum]
MTTISDISRELVGEIFSKVPITSVGEVRCTCKQWNGLSKHEIVGKAVAARQFMGFMMSDYRVCSLRFDLNGIREEDEGSNNNIDGRLISIKQIAKLNQIEIYLKCFTATACCFA